MSDPEIIHVPAVLQPGEKPLHVLVALALGCTPVERACFRGSKDREWACGCGPAAFPHGLNEDGPCPDDLLLDYDTDWAATGPLIQERRITILPWVVQFPRGWRAIEPRESAPPTGDLLFADAPTVVEAAARLIVEQGKRDGRGKF